MGVGPGVLSLYAQLRRDGLLTGANRMLELGSQVLVCRENQQAVLDVLMAFGVAPLDLNEVRRLAHGAPARELMEALGFEYSCVDLNGAHNAYIWDLNFDACPPEHCARYQFVTNHGTSEHVFNQYNSFKMMHDLTQEGGLMLHAVPFLSYVDHGYFNYQPNLFIDLARANGYELLGIWINPDPMLAHLIPWERGIEARLQIRSNDVLILVLYRKAAGVAFAVPLQSPYGDTMPTDVMCRYHYVVDGKRVEGRRGNFLSLEEAINRYYAIANDEQSVRANPRKRRISAAVVVQQIWRRATNRPRARF
jgi:hypothetical protein